MTIIEQAYFRRRLEGVSRAVLADAVVTAMGRVGGSAAFLAALAEAENLRAAQRTRRRIRSRATRETRS